MKNFVCAATWTLLLACGIANAVPVNGTGLVTNDVIFGAGNANGSWSGNSGGGIEVALRGKLRYDLFGAPQNQFNYDGVDTYTFAQSASNPPPGQSIFNFEFSANSDTGGTLNRNVNDINWLLTVDIDPGPGFISGFSGDVINGLVFVDHSFGNNGTVNGAGTEAADAAGYSLLRASNNLAQNSFNLGFNAPGHYEFFLSGSDSTGELASTRINVIVTAAVPEPTGLSLVGLGLLGLLRRTRA